MRPKLGFIAGAMAFVFSIMATRAVCADVAASADPGAGPSSQPTTSNQEQANFDGVLTGDWFGARRKLADAGISVGATLVAEGFANFMGGIDTAHQVGATTFDFNLTFDLEKLAHISNAEIYFDLESHAFRNPTTALVGDVQIFDLYNSFPYFQLWELWYQQTFFDGAFRFKVGKVDANTEFCVVDNGQTFLQSSAALTPSIFLMPTTPDPAPGINLFVTAPDSSPLHGLFASFGTYYSNQSEQFGDFVGNPSSAQFSQYGAFLIGETGYRWDALPFLHYAGNVKVGAWGHTGTFRRFDGTEQQGTGGAYALFNQTLYQPPGESADGRGVRMFLVGGGTGSHINVIDDQVGGGLSLTGPTQTRSGDIIGLGVTYAQISSQANLTYPFELAVEGFYQVRVTPWFRFQPDLQYIIHPGGRYPDALVMSLHAVIQF